MNTVDAREIQNFSKDAPRWWEVDGPFAPLHRLNPVRLQYLRGRIDAHFRRAPQNLTPYQGLTLLDIGCGGGLVCEPMARLGAAVTGIDADKRAIKTAIDHAAKGALDIEYRAIDTSKIKQQYDIVLALEVIEHVADPAQFVKDVVGLTRPGGLMIFSTLNRTPKSYALGIVAAEQILGWVAPGTHDWKKFVKPSELAAHLRNAGATPTHIQGMVYHPLKKAFALSDHHTDVNYFMVATRTA